MHDRGRGARADRRQGLQPRVRRPLPEAVHRRAHQAADQRAMEGRVALRRARRRTASSSSSRGIAARVGPAERWPGDIARRRLSLVRAHHANPTCSRSVSRLRTHVSHPPLLVSRQAVPLLQHRAPSPAPPGDTPSGGYFFAYRRSKRGRIDGNSRSMKRMKCVARAVLQVHHVAADEARAMIGDRLDRALEFVREPTEKPGTIGCHQDAGVDPGVDQRAYRAQPLQRMRRAGLELSPCLFVNSRHAHVDGAARDARELVPARRCREPPSAPS